MRNKLTNLLAWEPRFSIIFALIIAVMVAWFMLGKKEKLQFGRLSKVRAEKQLIAQIPVLEKKIRSGSGATSGTFKDEKDPVLKGIFMQDNIYYTVIENKFYQKGDTLGDFVISKIAFYYVVLQNKYTNQTKVIYYK